METSAFVPGAGELADSPEAVLAQARQEAVTLRGVLETIQEALNAAVARLEALEAQVLSGAERADISAARPSRPELPPVARGSRIAEWKQAGWRPGAGGTEVVTGETLRARREALGLSQAAIAHAAHCSRGLVAEVERGKRRSAQTLAHLASVLDRLEQARRK